VNDYQTKRRFRQRKLSKQGFYELRQQRSRARRRAERLGAGSVPSMKQIFDPENLITNYYVLKHRAGHAPGPDGITYKDLGPREVGQIMRDLSKEVLDGTYSPSRAREVRIRKANGRGYRTLKLRSILHRVVSAALADALGPFLDRMFLDGSHGFRHGRSPLTMLLELERIIRDEQRFVIAQDDIRDAFDNVAIEYVMELLRRYIDDEQLLIVSNKILAGHASEHRTVGIDQGSALSPLLLNVALHHGLDLPFSRLAAYPPWLRYADNVVYLARSAHEGATATQAAQRLLDPMGMTLKGTDGEPVDLLAGEKAKVLGFEVRWEQDQAHYDLTEANWDSLKMKLSNAHTHSHPRAAMEAVKGWMAACGPALEGKQDTPVLDKILEIAAEVGHRELPYRQLKRYLQSSLDRWVFRKEKFRGNTRKVSIGVAESREEGGSSAYHGSSGHLVMSEAVAPAG